MPWSKTGREPSLELVEASLRIIKECDPHSWVLEKVRGSIKYIGKLLGPPKQRHGPFFLWGKFPSFRAKVAPFKERLSSRRRAERAKVPNVVSEAIAIACERSLVCPEFSSP